MPKHVYPDAEWLPVEWANARDDDTNPTCGVLHVAASEAASLHGSFTRSRLACSHMYVRRDGSSDQYIRADRLSAADYRGSHRTFSIETQGELPGNGPTGSVRRWRGSAYGSTRTTTSPWR